MSTTIHVRYRHGSEGRLIAETSVGLAPLMAWGCDKESAKTALVRSVRKFMADQATAPEPEEVTI